jgi:hypothetical protein
VRRGLPLGGQSADRGMLLSVIADSIVLDTRLSCFARNARRRQSCAVVDVARAPSGRARGCERTQPNISLDERMLFVETGVFANQAIQ